MRPKGLGRRAAGADAGARRRVGAVHDPYRRLRQLYRRLRQPPWRHDLQRPGLAGHSGGWWLQLQHRYCRWRGYCSWVAYCRWGWPCCCLKGERAGRGKGCRSGRPGALAALLRLACLLLRWQGGDNPRLGKGPGRRRETAQIRRSERGRGLGAGPCSCTCTGRVLGSPTLRHGCRCRCQPLLRRRRMRLQGAGAPAPARRRQRSPRAQQLAPRQG